MPKFTRGAFGRSGVAIATLEVIQNERLIGFQGEESVFKSN